MKKILFGAALMLFFPLIGFCQTNYRTIQFDNYMHSTPSGFPGATAQIITTHDVPVNFEMKFNSSLTSGRMTFLFEAGPTYVAILNNPGTEYHTVRIPGNRAVNVHMFIFGNTTPVVTGPDSGGIAQGIITVLPGAGYSIGSSGVMTVGFHLQ